MTEREKALSLVAAVLLGQDEQPLGVTLPAEVYDLLFEPTFPADDIRRSIVWCPHQARGRAKEDGMKEDCDRCKKPMPGGEDYSGSMDGWLCTACSKAVWDFIEAGPSQARVDPARAVKQAQADALNHAVQAVRRWSPDHIGLHMEEDEARQIIESMVNAIRGNA